MLKFYRDKLGLTPHHERPGFVNFQWGTFRLTITEHDQVSGKNRDPLRLMINFSVHDIQTVHQRLNAHGIRFLRTPEQEDWRGWIATFEDPDGNTLQLLQQPDQGGPPD